MHGVHKQPRVIEASNDPSPWSTVWSCPLFGHTIQLVCANIFIRQNFKNTVLLTQLLALNSVPCHFPLFPHIVHCLPFFLPLLCICSVHSFPLVHCEVPAGGDQLKTVRMPRHVSYTAFMTRQNLHTDVKFGEIICLNWNRKKYKYNAIPNFNSAFEILPVRRS